MRILLDTHAFLWWLADSRRMSNSARRLVADGNNAVFVSAASAWEISTKHRLGKLPVLDPAGLDVDAAIADQGFDALSITVADAERAGRLPSPP